jgi:hypothetical protein
MAQLSGSSAQACIASGPDFTIESTRPARGAIDVPLNAPLVVHFKQVGLSRVTGEPLPTLSLRRAAQSEGQTLEPHELSDSSASTWSFLPSLLEPRASYEASLDTTFNGEVTSQSWTFTTGSEVVPPTRLVGELRVHFETGVDPVWSCQPGLCGDTCQQTGEHNVIKARIALPTMVDGFASYFAHGELFVSQAGFVSEQLVASRDPYVVPLEGPPFRVTMPLLENGQSYPPCFRYTVTDARLDGDSRTLCLDEPFAVDEPIPELASGTRTSESCSFAPARFATAHELGALLVIGALIRRRHSKKAPRG